MRVGIDASNVGGGGGITHLKEILSSFNWNEFAESIENITVFASQKVLDQLDEHDNIIKITFPSLNKGLVSRVLFQLYRYDKEANNRCDVLLAVTGDYLGSFKPLIGISRNMLLYERNIWKEIKQPKEVIRFYINFLKQKKCFKNADKIIFISEYAEKVIKKKLNLKHKKTAIIHHGVSMKFSKPMKEQLGIESYSFDKPFKLLYISTIHVYKNQWHVIEAISQLRKQGYPVECTFVGGVIFEPANRLVNKTIDKVDPYTTFINMKGHVEYEIVDKEYENANALIFASTCENMPNILMECMSSGRAIACSDKNPMPEFLGENGFYFNAKEPESIKTALIELIKSPSKRASFIENNKKEINKYSWTECSELTFKFILNEN